MGQMCALRAIRGCLHHVQPCRGEGSAKRQVRMCLQVGWQACADAISRHGGATDRLSMPSTILESPLKALSGDVCRLAGACVTALWHCLRDGPSVTACAMHSACCAKGADVAACNADAMASMPHSSAVHRGLCMPFKAVCGCGLGGWAAAAFLSLGEGTQKLQGCAPVTPATSSHGAAHAVIAL